MEGFRAPSDVVETRRLLEITLNLDKLRCEWEAIKVSTPQTHTIDDVLKVVSRLLVAKAYRGEHMLLLFNPPNWAMDAIKEKLTSLEYSVVWNGICFEVKW